jgi:hypothetical protein
MVEIGPPIVYPPAVSFAGLTVRLRDGVARNRFMEECKMALYKGKKALYEAIITKKAEQAQTQKKITKMPERPAAKPNNVASSGLFHWPTKPKAVQHTNGRVEMSFSVPVMVTFGFAVLVVLLVAFQVGKFASKPAPITASTETVVPTTTRAEEPVRSTRGEAALSARATKTEAVKAAVAKPVAPAGNKGNWIVLTQYQVSRDLEPVKEYFAKNGIETKVVARSSRGRQMYFLVTADTFESTGRAGSDGYQMIQKIRKVGAGYKAPQNYESFTPHLFGDAYGEKISQ